MRVAIAGPVRVRRGQTVHIYTKLRKGCNYGFVAVFSAVGDVEPSPHTPNFKMGLLRDGRPDFVSPTTVRLTRHARPQHKLELVADEDCAITLMQEIDVATDVRAIGRIVKNGTGLKALFAYACGWLHGNTRW